MRDIRCELLVCLILIGVQTSLHAQSLGSIPASALPSSSPSSSTPDTHSAELARQLEALSSALAVTHRPLETAQQEREQLPEELSQIKRLRAPPQSKAAEAAR